MKFTPPATQSDELDLNITSLIDVVFLLLIFFMVSTTFVDNAGIQVDLPNTSKNPEQSQQQSPPLVVAIDKTGIIFYKDSKTSLEELRTLFAELTQKPEQLIIRADTATAHGAVVSVMDIAQQSGITKISIAAESEAAS